jgi:hypothetical protein
MIELKFASHTVGKSRVCVELEIFFFFGFILHFFFSISHATHLDLTNLINMESKECTIDTDVNTTNTDAATTVSTRTSIDFPIQQLNPTHG